jgi:hypothetical protein
MKTPYHLPNQLLILSLGLQTCKLYILKLRDFFALTRSNTTVSLQLQSIYAAMATAVLL